MKDAIERLAKARLDERLARARWFDTLDELQDRATPGGIADELLESIQEGISEVAGKAVNAAKERPFTTAAAGLLVALFAFRKPIIRSIGRKLGRRKETDPQGDALDV